MKVNNAFDWAALARISVKTAPEALVVAGLPALALITERNCDFRQLAFFGCVVVGSIILVTLSFQDPYLITPFAIPAIVLTKLTSDREILAARMTFVATLVAFVFGFSLYFFPALEAILKHAWFANHSLPIEGMPRAYASLRVPSEISLDPLDRAFSNTIDGAQAYAAARSAQPPPTPDHVYAVEYAHTLTDLPNAQGLCGADSQRTLILDFANVSSSLLSQRPVGGYADANFPRGFNQSFHWPEERIFAAVDCLLDPKLPADPATKNGLWLVYGDAIRNRFTTAGQTRFWRVLIRR